MDLVKRLSEYCNLFDVCNPTLEMSDSADQNVCRFDSSALHKIIGTHQPFLKWQCKRSWVYKVPVPANLREFEVVALMVASTSYDMNPYTFAWPASSNDTYVQIWKLISRISRQLGKNSVFSRQIGGRNAEGYEMSTSTRSRKMIPEPPRTLFDVSPMIAKVLDSYEPDSDPEQEEFRMTVIDIMDPDERMYQTIDQVALEGFVKLTEIQRPD